SEHLNLRLPPGALPVLRRAYGSVPVADQRVSSISTANFLEMVCTSRTEYSGVDGDAASGTLHRSATTGQSDNLDVLAYQATPHRRDHPPSTSRCGTSAAASSRAGEDSA